MTMNIITLCMEDVLLVLCAYLFLSPLKIIEHKKLQTAGILILVGCLLLLLRVFLPAMSENIVLESLIRMILLLSGIIFIYKKISWEAVYCSIWPFMTYYCINILWETFEDIAGLHRLDIVMNSIVMIAFFGIIDAILAFTLIRWLPRNGKFHAGPKRTLSALLILFLSQYSNYNYNLTNGQSNLAILVQIYCVTFLYLQAELFKKSEMNQELSMMERLWYQQKKQYKIAKDQMQVIDRKCHDLKYQVAAMRHIENPQEREKNLKELEQSIRIYDSIVKTGNEILDTLLSEKSLICEARNISIHCVIDGSRLSYLDPIDIYALFGNAIDNAMECVEKFKENEMRFIDVCVTEKQNFIYIRISNPINSQPEYEGDLPKTTKKNKQYHGIGLKSIRQIAEKYGGEITVTTELNCFNLEILLPLTSKK